MKWANEHIKLLIIMIVIIVLMAIIAVSIPSDSDSEGSQASLVGAIQNTISVVQKPLSDAGNGFTSFFSGLFRFRSTQKENYELKQEIEELEQELTETKLTNSELQELRNLYNELNYATYDDEYTPVTAKVTAMEGSDTFNIFTIGAGTDEGIDKDDLVIVSDGLVGRVMSVASDSAKVIGIVDSSNSVSFTVLRDPEIIGIISGDGEGGLTGYIFDESKSILEGDTIVTSGMGYYPAGVKIGIVSDVKLDSNTKRKTITADSAVDFNAIRTVSVMTQ